MVQKDIKAILENLEEEKEKHSKKEDNKVFDPSESPTLSLYEEVNSAIVVGCLLKGEDSSEVEADLKELGSLLFTLGIKVCGSFIQKVEKFSSKSLIGTGKIQEILKEALDKKVGMIVFDKELSPVQTRYLEDNLKLRVLDRTGIILEIFAKHAGTNQAKTQVELSQLEYMLPRMSGAWTHFQRQQGGVNLRGMGEKQIEIDRRRARDRIAKLKKQLVQFDKEKSIQKKSRKDELKVALVGYTNSGKTTLMNALTNEHLMAKDILFATLDTSVRVIDPKTRPKILLSDTVGFIKNLPHSLIESFKSTLQEVRDADLLLHVVDISSSNFKEQMEITNKVLEEIGATEIPVIYVFNKIDLIEDDPFLPKIMAKSYPKSVCTSATDQSLAHRVRETIYEFFTNDMITQKIRVNLKEQKILSLIYRLCMILGSECSEDGSCIYEIRTTKKSYQKIKPFIEEV